MYRMYFNSKVKLLTEEAGVTILAFILTWVIDIETVKTAANIFGGSRQIFE